MPYLDSEHGRRWSQRAIPARQWTSPKTDRKGVRLQGFPEDFKWPELARGPKYKLIGNAVSPPVARLLADFVKRALEDENNEHRLGISA